MIRRFRQTCTRDSEGKPSMTDIELLSNDFPENWLADVANHLKNIGCTAHPDSQMRDSVKRFADVLWFWYILG